MFYRFQFFLKVTFTPLLVFSFLQTLSAQPITCQIVDSHTYQLKFQLKNLRFEKNSLFASGSGNFGPVPFFENGTLVPTANQPLLSQTGFSLVWPQKGKPAITVTILKKEEIQNIQIPIFRDSSNIFNPENTNSNSSTVHYGGVQIFQEIPLHSFQIKPFRYDQASKSLTIYSEISILISFREEFEPIIYSGASKKVVKFLKKMVLNGDQFQFRTKQKLQGLKKNYANNWYDPNKKYLKVYVREDGVYHLNRSDFSQFGMNITGLDPRKLTCFYLGKPYPIFVSGENDGSFDNNDYIEFTGRRNPGDNQFYNDYSDTSVYWFTFGDEFGLRTQFRSVAPIGGPPQSSFYYTEHREEDNLYHSGGDERELNIFNSDRTPGEGWYWQRIDAGDEITYKITAYNYASSPQPDSLKIKVRGLTNDRSVSPDHHVEISINNEKVSEFYFDGVQDVIHKFEIPKGIVKLGNNDVVLRSLTDTGAQYDAIFLDWFELSHPRVYIASDARLFFTISDSLINQTATINITNFHQDSIVVYDLANNSKLVNFQIQPYADRFYISLSDSVTKKNRYAAYAANGIQKPARIVLDQPSDLGSTLHQADYLIVTHKKFRQQADELADYRRQKSGLTPFVADIEDIFDEFNYGLLDPLATRSFIKYAVENWQKPSPQFVLFFGDASWDFKKNAAGSVKENYVPSYGNPVADNRLVSIDGETDFLPDLYAGRIPVESVEEAAEVVRKIKFYEEAPFSAWQKNVIFLNGGFNDWEQNIFKSQSESLIQNFVTPGPFGGNPVRIYKEADGLVIGELLGDILSAINNGALWLSFLGHAGSETWDLMMRNENILELENSDKYPFITSMTCHTARFANPVITSFGELFLKVPGKGAIAFWGTTGWGYIYQDNILINRLFKLTLQDKKLSLGEATTLAKLYLWDLLGDSQINRSSVDQYTLLGDPALQLAYPQKPDFAIKNSGIKIIPEEPTEDDTTLNVRFNLNNYGLVPEDSVAIDIKLNSTGTTRIKLKHPSFTKEVSSLLSLNDMVGEVKLEVVIDPENLIPEIQEDNNFARRDFYIYSTSISLSKPLPFSVFDNRQPFLQVYSPEFSGESSRTYFFELDTTNSFDSPFRIKSEETEETKIVTKWQVPQTLEPGVYFWRCRMFDGLQYSKWLQNNVRISSTVSPVSWRQNDETGFLLPSNNTVTVRNNAIVLAKDPENVINLEVQSSGYEDGSRCYLILNHKIINQKARGHHILVINGNDGQIIAGPVVFDTFARSSAADSLADFIDNQPSNAVFLIGIRDEGSFRMTEKAYQSLESLGSALIRNVGFRDSWGLIGRKGAATGSVPESWQLRGNGTAVVRDTLSIFYYNNGSLSSGEIGPATNWKQLHWDIELPDSQTHFLLQLLGFDRQSQNWDVLQEIDQGENFDLKTIFARNYPKLKLNLTLSSDDGLSSPVFKNWQADYDFPPDYTTHPDLFAIDADSLLEGLPLNLKVPIFNVGFANSDSVLVRIDLQNRQSDWDSVASQFAVVNADDSVQLKFVLPTTGYPGAVKYRATLDPDDRINELSETNNQYSGKLFVQSDTIRPDIKITFNDQEILPGDLVSFEPNIKIEIKDNSPLAIQDTSLIRLFLNNQPLYYKKLPEKLEFSSQPADLAKGTETVVFYHPELKPGQHVLEVFAKDATQNQTYSRADFEVVSELSLRAVMNVPNPFSTETSFTYILTQPVDYVSLSVFTVAGRLIYKMDDLPNTAGFNSYLWEALDSDGDEIANGVYLYKIEARCEDKSVSEINKFIIVK